MGHKELGRKQALLRAIRLAAGTATVVAWSTAAPVRAADDGDHAGLWDSLLQTLDVKAKPAGPAPGFVEKTRPRPAGLDYMQQALPHKVSPVAVKSPAQIQAAKDALDDARTRQLNRAAPVPADLGKAKKASSSKAAHAE